MTDDTSIDVLNIEQMTASENEPSSAKLIFALGLAGFLSGILLVSTYLYTLPKIEANKAAALQSAIFKVLPECKTFDTYELSGSQLQLLNLDDQTVGSKTKETLKIFAGFDEKDSFIGFAIPAQISGFQDIIGALYGFEPITQTIVGFEVLESKETPGLGDKIFKDADFQLNFKALETLPEVIAEKREPGVNDNEVEAITGATISSKAVVRLLNTSLTSWRPSITDFMQNHDNEINKQAK